MSRAWDYSLRPLDATELARTARFRCSTGKCEGTPTHMSGYRYVTGRAGRTNHAARMVCRSHAEKFAAKHGLVASPPAPVTG